MIDDGESGFDGASGFDGESDCDGVICCDEESGCDEVIGCDGASGFDGRESGFGAICCVVSCAIRPYPLDCVSAIEGVGPVQPLPAKSFRAVRSVPCYRVTTCAVVRVRKHDASSWRAPSNLHSMREF